MTELETRLTDALKALSTQWDADQQQHVEELDILRVRIDDLAQLVTDYAAQHEQQAAAVWVHGLVALRGCARGSHAERADCPSHGVLVERAPAGRALAMGEQDRTW